METQLWSDAQMMQGRTIFLEMFRQQEQRLLRAARRLCRGNEDRAQDLVQDTLLRACQACMSGRFHEGFNTYAWLLRILKNLAINDYHRCWRQPASLDIDSLTASGEACPAKTHAAPADVTGVALMARTLDEEVEQALTMLSVGLRQCVVLVDMEGDEYIEAARTLGIPVGTVRSRLSRARLQLGSLLQAYGQERGLVREESKTELMTVPLCKRGQQATGNHVHSEHLVIQTQREI